MDSTMWVRSRPGPRVTRIAAAVGNRSETSVGLCDRGEQSVDEFVGGGVPLVGGQEATRFQARGTVRSGQEDGGIALSVPFANDGRDDGEELVAHPLDRK